MTRIIGGRPIWVVVVVVDDSHIQRIVLATENTCDSVGRRVPFGENLLSVITYWSKVTAQLRDSRLVRTLTCLVSSVEASACAVDS